MPSSAIEGHMLIRREFLIISSTIAIALAIYIPNIHISSNNWDMDAYRRVMYTEKPLDMAWRLLTDFQGRIVTEWYAPLSSISLMLDKLMVRSQFPLAEVVVLVNLLIHILNGF
jgi:hypothetical protein